MGPIANYDLGSVHGEVKISYDRQGITDARQDINQYLGDVNRLREALRQYEQNQQSSSQSAQNFGQAARDAESSVDSLGAALRSISRVPILLGATQEVVAFGAELAPLLGLVAAMPAALGVGAAAMATFKIATQGMGDAMAAVAEGDAEALNEALKNLSPSAQEFVRSYARIRPVWDAMQLKVQEELFRGLGGTLEQLANTYLPTLENGLVGVAAGWRRAAVESAQAMMSPETVQALNNVLADTEMVVEDVGGAVGHVFAGLINMAGAGSHWINLWTMGATDAASRFREWTASAEGQAQINTWIQQGANVLGELVKIIMNLGSIASGVFNAMETSGGGILSTLVQLTTQAAAWVNSAEGQAVLVPIFQMLHDITMAVVGVFTILAGIVGQVVVWFTSLPAPIQAIVVQFIAWSAVLGIVIGWLTPLITFITALVSHAGMLITVLRGLWTAFQLIITVFKIITTLFMANPWLLLIAAVIALVAIIITNWDTIKTYLAAAWQWIVDTAATVWGGIVAFFAAIWEQIKGPVQTAWSIIQTIIQVAWDIILNILRYGAAILLALFFTMWNPLVDIVTTVWNAIVAFITPILQTIQSAISTAWNAVSSATSAVWNTILSVLTTVWNAIWGVIGPYVEMARAAIETAWNAISSATSSVWNTITGLISSAWNTITGIFNGAVATVMGVLQGLWNRISGLASSAMNLLVNAGRNIVTGLWNGIVAMGSWLYNKIMGWIRSVVPGPILQFLGIASPSKWMRKEVGRELPPGLALGIEDETKVATDASRAMAQRVAEAAQLSNLPVNVQQRVGVLASVTGAVAPAPSVSVAAASAPAVAAGSGRVINVGNLTLQIAGNLDPTDPVRWRAAIETIREDLTNVEASYR